MKKTIALAAAVAVSFAAATPASAEMDRAQVWTHSSAVAKKFVKDAKCSTLEGHVLGAAGLKKGASLAAVKTAFSSENFLKGLAAHLAENAPHSDAHSGADYDKVLGAVTSYAAALTAQKLNNECKSLSGDNTKAVNEWVAKEDNAGKALVQSGGESDKGKDKGKDKGDDHKGGDAPGSSFFNFSDLFKGFSS